MSWPLRRIEWKTPLSELKPGDWCTRPAEDIKGEGTLSNEFLASGRTEVVFIRLPGKCGAWSPDYQFHGTGGTGWTLTLTEDGSPFTATPSVNVEGCYHGWLQNGALTDDCEGRAFG
jgi:hypothetical protein